MSKEQVVVTDDIRGPVTAIKFGRLWDGQRTLSNAMVVVKGERISSVSADGRVPPGARIIDLGPYTGIPGMIDMHTHITLTWCPHHSTTPLNQPPRRPAYTVVFAQKNGMKALEAGVTTLRDLWAGDFADIDLRDLINSGALVGPRLFVSGGALFGLPDISTLGERIAEQIRVTQGLITAGADWIKIFASTGGFDDVTGDQTMSYHEIQAIVDTAHSAGRKVAVHSYGPDGARDAIRAGCDTLEHATDMDDQTIGAMVEKKIWYVPTIDHNQYYVENSDHVYKFSLDAKERLKDFIQRNYETARRAYHAGARMLVGSDAVYNGFGLNMRELTWFSKMGMPNEKALRTVTVDAAEALGMGSEIGAVVPGAFADIVALKGDPLRDINAVLEGVRWVMKGGEVVCDVRDVELRAGTM